jgi:hypothetical protein
VPPTKKKKRDGSSDLVPDEWMTLKGKRGSYLQLPNKVDLERAITICPIWDIKIGDFRFTGCVVSVDFYWRQYAQHGTSDYIAKVPNGPTLVLTGKESVYPRRDLHEQRKKKTRLAKLKAQLRRAEESTGKKQKAAARVKAQIAELEAS